MQKIIDRMKRCLRILRVLAYRLLKKLLASARKKINSVQKTGGRLWVKITPFQPALPVAIFAMLALWGFGWTFIEEIAAICLAILTVGFLKTRSVFVAVKSKCGSIIPALVFLGADVNARGNYGFTPLHEAVKDGNAEIIPILVKSGAKVNAWDDGIRTPLHEAVRCRKPNLIWVLFKWGANVNAKIGFGPAPLHEAVEEGEVDAILALIRVAADVNVTNGDGWTPLHVAAIMKQRVRSASLLINAEANVNAKDRKGLTPLDHAIKHKNPDVAELLRANGAK